MDQPQSPTPARRYSNGQPWKPAAGHNAPRQQVEDRLGVEYAVVDLSRQPSADYLVKAVVREMRIRFYQPNTIAAYRSALACFLRWYRGQMDQVTQEDIREYLDLLVTGGASSSHVSVTLSALRTVFDKFCLLRCTVGLVSPKKAKRLPVVLSKQEVQRLISAGRSFRDKLLISVLYATGLRVSEVSRLSWSDLDFERRQVRVSGGKGRKDRYVMLAEHLLPLLRQVWRFTRGEGYLFPAEGQRSTNRHLSTRTIERAVANARRLSGIAKHVTPHSMRHSFATHLIESGTDIRFIQKLLGHTNLETTSLYTKVATTVTSRVSSPLDQIQLGGQQQAVPPPPSKPAVGKVSIRVEDPPDASGVHRVFLGIQHKGECVTLPGTTVSEPRPGWINLQVPAIEVWQPSLSRLPNAQQDRIQQIEFYEMLQREVSKRMPRPDS